MAISVTELIRWASTLPVDAMVGIDHGGSILEQVDGDAFLEIGGYTVELPDDNPTYTRNDWAYEVEVGDTRLGYDDWVQHQIEAAKFSPGVQP